MNRTTAISSPSTTLKSFFLPFSNFSQVNSYVASKATQNGILYWLGLTCLSASTCYWTDGSPLNYTNWETGNPLLDLGNCAYILASGRWVSAGCDNTYYGAFCLSNAREFAVSSDKEEMSCYHSSLLLQLQ